MLWFVSNEPLSSIFLFFLLLQRSNATTVETLTCRNCNIVGEWIQFINSHFPLLHLFHFLEEKTLLCVDWSCCNFQGSQTALFRESELMEARGHPSSNHSLACICELMFLLFPERIQYVILYFAYRGVSGKNKKQTKKNCLLLLASCIFNKLL